WIGAHGTAVLEVLQDPEAILHDALRLQIAQTDDEADAAGIMLAGGIEQAGLDRGMKFASGRLGGDGKISIPRSGHVAFLHCSMPEDPARVPRPFGGHASTSGRTSTARAAGLS